MSEKGPLQRAVEDVGPEPVPPLSAYPEPPREKDRSWIPVAIFYLPLSSGRLGGMIEQLVEEHKGKQLVVKTANGDSHQLIVGYWSDGRP